MFLEILLYKVLLSIKSNNLCIKYLGQCLNIMNAQQMLTVFYEIAVYGTEVRGEGISKKKS